MKILNIKYFFFFIIFMLSNEILCRNCNNSTCESQHPLILEHYPGEDCFRECVVGEPSRVCYFKFVLEHYHAMGPSCGDCAKGVEEHCYNPTCITADGVEKGVMSINRKIPGPEIHVCQNDLLVVDVANHMAGASSTIHWHGLHQRATPHMDGVPFITQCPIEYSTTFRYSFRATEPGTQFYHSHSGHHKVNGHYGALIIRRPRELDQNNEFYDFDKPEHVILVSDWMHETGEMFMPGLPTRPNGIHPVSLLINGFGKYTNPITKIQTRIPYHKYFVKQNYGYRFRFIMAASHICPVTLQIENHKMLIVATDSFDVEPVVVDTLLAASGERYDIVIETSAPVRDYFIRVRAVGPCDRSEIEQFAILSYIPDEPLKRPPPFRRPPPYRLPYADGVYLNHPNTTCSRHSPNEYCVTDLTSYDVDNELRTAIPDHKFYLAFENYAVETKSVFTANNYDHFMNPGGDTILMSAINNLSLTYPSFSLLTQPEQITEDLFCEEGRQRPESCAGKQICHCLHRIKIQLNSIVELVIVDEAAAIRNLHHPFHLHGFRFMVTNMGQHPLGIPLTVSLVKNMEKARTLPVSVGNHNPPFKDTVGIPSRGFAVVRFRADNPGFWLMHCHFEWHTAVGMAVVVQVGELDEMVKPPKNFPKCNNFVPDINELEL